MVARPPPRSRTAPTRGWWRPPRPAGPPHAIATATRRNPPPAGSCRMPPARLPTRPGVARPGASATVAPGTSADSSAAAVSGLALKPSASGGTAPARTRSPVGTCLPPARYPWPAAVRTNAAGGGGALSRSRPGLPEAIISRVTLHRSCCHARLPERYRTRRYGRAHLADSCCHQLRMEPPGHMPIPGVAPSRSGDLLRLVHEHAIGNPVEGQGAPLERAPTRLIGWCISSHRTRDYAINSGPALAGGRGACRPD